MLYREIVLFYVWPIVVLYLLQTSGVATVYMIGVGISGFRHYFNIVAVIEETGTMNLKPGRSRRKRWLKQARLTDIVDEISTDKSKRVWLAVLASLSVIFLLLFIGGLVQGDTAEGDSVELSKCKRLTSIACLVASKVTRFLPTFFGCIKKHTYQNGIIHLRKKAPNTRHGTMIHCRLFFGTSTRSL